VLISPAHLRVLSPVASLSKVYLTPEVPRTVPFPHNCDILPAVNDGASHAHQRAVRWELTASSPTNSWRCHAAVTPLTNVTRSYLVVFCRSASHRLTYLMRQTPSQLPVCGVSRRDGKPARRRTDIRPLGTEPFRFGRLRTVRRCIPRLKSWVLAPQFKINSPVSFWTHTGTTVGSVTAVVGIETAASTGN
jgi:hypothetical protein